MSGETLRKAAAQMRRDASNATPGRWKLWGMTVMADQDGTSNVDTAIAVAQTHYRDENGKPRTWDASHVAGMQPAVALAVADWLDAEAWVLEGMQPLTDLVSLQVSGSTASISLGGKSDGAHALAVARAYLGERP